MLKVELQKSAKKTQEALSLVADESAKAKAAKEVIKLLTAQLKDVTERLPPGVYNAENIRAFQPNSLEANGIHPQESLQERHSRSESLSSSIFASRGIDPSTVRGSEGSMHLSKSSETYSSQQNRRLVMSNGTEEYPGSRLRNGAEVVLGVGSNLSDAVFGKKSGPFQDSENGMWLRSAALTNNSNEVEAEWIEQYEAGVYITLVALQDGTRDLKRVRFSRRRFGEHQAEIWWLKNREKVYERYNVRGTDKSSGQAGLKSDEAVSPVSQP